MVRVEKTAPIRVLLLDLLINSLLATGSIRAFSIFSAAVPPFALRQTDK